MGITPGEKADLANQKNLEICDQALRDFKELINNTAAFYADGSRNLTKDLAKNFLDDLLKVRTDFRTFVRDVPEWLSLFSSLLFMNSVCQNDEISRDAQELLTKIYSKFEIDLRVIGSNIFSLSPSDLLHFIHSFAPNVEDDILENIAIHDGYACFVLHGSLYVKTPLPPRRAYMINLDQNPAYGRFLYPVAMKEPLYFVLDHCKEMAQLKLENFTKKHIFYVFNTSAQPNRIVDNDNYDIHVLQNILTGRLGGDNGHFCSSSFISISESSLPEGAYITITPGLFQQPELSNLIQLWKEKLQ